MKFEKIFLTLLLGTVSAVYPVSPGRAPLARAASDCVANKSILEASQAGQIDKIKRLISSTNIDCINQNGVTPLMLATYYGHAPIIQFLLTKKANTNLASTANHDFNFGKLLSNRNNKTTALMLAAFAGKLEIVLALLKAGAQVNAQDSDGQTALMYAILADKNWPNQPLPETRKKIIKLLLEFGADPNLADTNGLDTLYYYCQVAGLVPSFGDRYEKDAELEQHDELLLRMK